MPVTKTLKPLFQTLDWRGLSSGREQCLSLDGASCPLPYSSRQPKPVPVMCMHLISWVTDDRTGLGPHRPWIFFECMNITSQESSNWVLNTILCCLFSNGIPENHNQMLKNGQFHVAVMYLLRLKWVNLLFHLDLRWIQLLGKLRSLSFWHWNLEVWDFTRW